MGADDITIRTVTDAFASSNVSVMINNFSMVKTCYHSNSSLFSGPLVPISTDSPKPLPHFRRLMKTLSKTNEAADGIKQIYFWIQPYWNTI